MTATTTKTYTTFIVHHGNCVTMHDSREEAMSVYNNGGCAGVTSETTEYLLDDTGFILEARIDTAKVA